MRIVTSPNDIAGRGLRCKQMQKKIDQPGCQKKEPDEILFDCRKYGLPRTLRCTFYEWPFL